VPPLVGKTGVVSQPKRTSYLGNPGLRPPCGWPPAPARITPQRPSVPSPGLNPDCVVMSTPSPSPRQALATCLGLGFLAAVAAASLWQVDLPALCRARAEAARAFPDPQTNPAATTFLVSDLRRFPCIVERRRHARVERLNPAIDRYDPGVDAPDSAARPLDSWEKMDNWSVGYWRSYDPFLGYDF
jgi:hypothetical protein